ncbi:MAG: hypothetical protein ACK5ME_00575 [Parahaliea sp.]
MKSYHGTALFSIASALTLVTASTSSNAKDSRQWYEKIHIGGYVAQGWQSAFEVDGASALPSDEDAQSGFQRLRYALHISAKLTDRISIFAELAEEPNDFSGITKFAISQDLAWVDVKLNDYNNVRVGNLIAYPGSMTFLYYSDGAVVQANPLIGNSPVDMITAEEGVWFLGKKEMGAGKLNWDLSVSTPNFFSDFSDGAGYDYRANLTYIMDNGFGFGAGIFQTTGDPQCDGGLCILNSGGSVNSSIGLGDGDNYEFSTGGPATRATHVALIPAIEASIYQIDVHYENERFMLQGIFGVAKDDYSFYNGFGSGQFLDKEAKMQYASITTKINLNESIYLTARYSISSNKSDGIDDDEILDRYQLGLGYWFDKDILVKAEYVKQTEEANSGGLKTNGNNEASWDGFSVELSYHF